MSDAAMCPTILAILLDKRTQNAIPVQAVLTKHGCAIRLRVVLHEAGEGDRCANWGLILLQVCGSCEEAGALEADLAAIDGVKVKSMCLDFDE
jgi:hypothetical protein